MQPLHAQLLQLAQPPKFAARPLSSGQPLSAGYGLNLSILPIRSQTQMSPGGHTRSRLQLDGVVIDVYRKPLQTEVYTCWGKRSGPYARCKHANSRSSEE